MSGFRLTIWVGCVVNDESARICVGCVMYGEQGTVSASGNTSSEKSKLQMPWDEYLRGPKEDEDCRGVGAPLFFRDEAIVWSS
jgi:hypothetical protein